VTSGPSADDPAEPTVCDNQAASRFEICLDEAVVGYLSYARDGDVLTAIHTEIDDAYAGRGLASQLVRTVLDLSRNTGLLVRPVCPFVSAYIARHPEYRDLVKES
jgi:uncharacterized protein